MRRLWPQSLGGRLVVLLLCALAAAQGIVLFVIDDEQKAVVWGMAHGQALNQTVTLARLLSHYPPDEAAPLLAAFGSRTTCARLVDTVPSVPDESLDGAERHLTAILRNMLHGDFAGEPRVTIARSADGDRDCGTRAPAASNYAASAEETRSVRFVTHAAEAVVPLKDGRTLVFRTFIDAPSVLTWIAVLSFLLSSAAITAAVIVVVRRQTQLLRDLAGAADRLGRGDEGVPLEVAGPIEIAAVVRAFNTMQERLRRFVSERLHLLAAVSHDLRTPLTTLRLKAEFIDDEATRDDMIATIEELTAITETTLAFTRAEATSEKTATVDLTHLIEDIAEDFRLGGGEVETAVAPPVLYDCRPVALKRAVRNLVENAVRYGGRARISVSQSADGPCITVDDDGPGLPAGRVEDAFEPFVRLEPSRSAETGGLGLGLAITRGIVHAHGGRITLVNRPEGGLRAEIGLPARR